MALDLRLHGRKIGDQQHVADAPMLRPDVCRMALAADLAAKDNKNVTRQRLPESDDHIVAGGCTNLAMERKIGFADGGPIERFGRTRHRLDDLIEPEDALRIGPIRDNRVAQRDSLQRHARLAD